MSEENTESEVTQLVQSIGQDLPSGKMELLELEAVKLAALRMYCEMPIINTFEICRTVGCTIHEFKRWRKEDDWVEHRARFQREGVLLALQALGNPLDRLIADYNRYDKMKDELLQAMTRMNRTPQEHQSAATAVLNLEKAQELALKKINVFKDLAAHTARGMRALPGDILR